MGSAVSTPVPSPDRVLRPSDRNRVSMRPTERRACLPPGNTISSAVAPPPAGPLRVTRHRRPPRDAVPRAGYIGWFVHPALELISGLPGCVRPARISSWSTPVCHGRRDHAPTLRPAHAHLCTNSVPIQLRTRSRPRRVPLRTDPPSTRTRTARRTVTVQRLPSPSRVPGH